MSLNFPDAPSVDDTYGSYIWDGEKWDYTGQGAPGTANLKMSDTPPSGAIPGDMWMETDTGFIFVLIDDGTSLQWVVSNPVVPVAGPQGEVGPIGPQGIQGDQGIPGIGASVNTQDDPPTDPDDGDLWWESDSGRIHVFYETQWVQAAAATADADQSRLVMRTGDTMSGFLILNADATNALGAATKAQVDAAVVAAGSATDAKAVRYDVAQPALTDAQELQARQNIYAAPLDAIGLYGVGYNGSMEINQELAGAARTTGGHIVDSYELSFTGTMVLSAQQVADAPPGLIYSCKITATTGQAVLGASDYWTIIHRMEGIRIARLAWATASAQPLQVCFWAKSSRTGVFTGCVRNSAGTRSYPWTYNITAANTWEWKVIPIPPDPTTLIDTGMVTSMQCLFTPAVGATRAGPPGAWSSNSPTYLGANTSVTAIATNETFQITGVMLIPGNDAPPASRSALIMRPNDQELLLCQRYYWTYNIIVDTPAISQTFMYPVLMRITPTFVGGGAGFTAGTPTARSVQFYQTTRAYQVMTASARM
jgi:hypothetical protein